MLPTEHDIRCATACTRAGVAVLFLAVVSFGLTEPIEKAIELNRLLVYTHVRVTLSRELQRLVGDRAWQSLFANDSTVTNWPLSKLLDYAVDGHRIEPLHRVAAEFRRLDENTLAAARRYSPKYDHAIYKWDLVRWGLKSRVRQRSRLETSTDWISGLTLQELTMLANLDAPSIEELDALLKEKTGVTFPSSGVPLAYPAGATIVQTAALLAFFYFWLFYREARQSRTFPADETLFGALARSRRTRIVFEFLVLIPAIAAVNVVFAMRPFWRIGLDDRNIGMLGEPSWNGAIALGMVLLAWLIIWRQPLSSKVYGLGAAQIDAGKPCNT